MTVENKDADGYLINILFELCDELGAITKPHELCTYFDISEDEARVLVDKINAGIARHPDQGI